jgi:hypothetical protein
LKGLSRDSPTSKAVTPTATACGEETLRGGDGVLEEECKEGEKNERSLLYETGKLFEMEDPEGLGDDWESKDYVEPNLETAVNKGLSMRFLSGKARFFETTIAQLGHEGIGVGLYFLILRSLATIFFVMSIISIPALTFNALGSGVPPAEQDSLLLSLTTLGNQVAYCVCVCVSVIDINIRYMIYVYVCVLCGCMLCV